MAIFATPRLPRSIAAFLAVAGVAGAVAAAGPSPASAAPIQTAKYDFNLAPDFDQRRDMGTDAAGVAHAGLPGNGAAYCGPTAALDAFAWLARTADPTIAPGVRDWASADNYEFATSQLAALGATMRTDATNGTMQSNLEHGLDQWTGGKYVYYSHMGEDVDYAPDMSIAQRALQSGAPVIALIGWYKPVTRTIDGGRKKITMLERTGGHYVSVTGWGPEGITFVDPDDTTNTMAPSAATQVTKVATVEDHVTGFNDNGTEKLDRGWTKKSGVYTIPTTRYLHMPTYQGGGGDGYIEGFTFLGPKWALTFDGSNLKYTLPGKERSWPIPPGQTVADAQVSPLGDSVYYALKGGRALYKANIATGAAARITTVSAPITKLAVNTAGSRISAASGRTITTVTSAGRQVSVFRPDVATLPGNAQFDPTVLQAPRAGAAVANPYGIDTAVETPSLLTERVIRSATSIPARGAAARHWGT